MSDIDVHVLEDVGRVQITVDGFYVQFPVKQTTEMIAKILRASAETIPEPLEDNVVPLDLWSRKV